MLIILSNRFRSFRKISVILVVSAVLIFWMNISGCSKQQIQMPSVSQTADGQHHAGKFVWFDLYTDDLKSTTRFYEEVFGWSFQTTSFENSNVKTIFRQGIPIANAIYTKPLKKDIKESRWLGYISVDDVDRACQVIEQNKGSIYLTPRNVPNRGRVAVVIDPEGAIFGIIKTNDGDPPDSGKVENYWMGSELWTTDLDSATNFYHLVAGYEAQQVRMGNDTDYTFLVKDETPRAGLVKITWDHIKPDWLPYIAVSDVVDVVGKAQKMGGNILVKPDTSGLEGLVAIITDPSGAVFAVQQLPDKDSREEQ